MLPEHKQYLNDFRTACGIVGQTTVKSWMFNKESLDRMLEFIDPQVHFGYSVWSSERHCMTTEYKLKNGIKIQWNLMNEQDGLYYAGMIIPRQQKQAVTPLSLQQEQENTTERKGRKR